MPENCESSIIYSCTNVSGPPGAVEDFNYLCQDYGDGEVPLNASFP